MKKIVVFGVSLAVVATIVIVVAMAGRNVHDVPSSPSGEVVVGEGRDASGTVHPITASRSSLARDVAGALGSDEDVTAVENDSEDAAAEPQTEEERREAEEERQVNAFDDLTDKWMEPAGKGVTLADIDGFVKSFRRIPKARQDECIHRALNLIPDENVMLLAGVLMDKAMDKEVVETVYNDILNRNEDVKKPILQQIFKDKTHPCWADTAWILDVTGELPGKK